MFDWLLSASAAGFGAFFGALGAYWLAYRQEKNRQKIEYLCLLMIVYEHLESLYTTFADIPESTIEEVNGVKFVTFDMPLPDLDVTAEQMQRLMELAPDKDMPSTLIKVQHFLKAHSRRVEISGSNTLTIDFVRQQARQLQFMLLSIRTQYEQISNVAFPLDELSSK